MKKISLILLLFAYSLNAYTQSFYQVLQDLELPLYNINEKPKPDMTVRKMFNTKAADVPISHPMFEKVTLYYDELDELNGFVYSLKKNALKKNQPRILEILRKNYGKESDVKVETGTYPSVTYEFINGNTKVSLSSDKLIGDRISFWPIENLKIFKVFDEFNKTTKLTAINVREYVSSDNGLEYKISFAAFKESKNIFITVVSESKEWKFMNSIQILLDSGSVKKFDLTSKKEVVDGILGVTTIEVGSAFLPKEIYESINASNQVRIRINGEKKTGDIVLNASQKKSLTMLINEVHGS